MERQPAAVDETPSGGRQPCTFSRVIAWAGPASPGEAEAGAVPAKEGLGLDDNDHPTPTPEQARSHEELELGRR